MQPYVRFKNVFLVNLHDLTFNELATNIYCILLVTASHHDENSMTPRFYKAFVINLLHSFPETFVKI